MIRERDIKQLKRDIEGMEALVKSCDDDAREYNESLANIREERENIRSELATLRTQEVDIYNNLKATRDWKLCHEMKLEKMKAEYAEAIGETERVKPWTVERPECEMNILSFCRRSTA